MKPNKRCWFGRRHWRCPPDPGLIENNPHNNGGAVPMVRHHRGQSAIKVHASTRGGDGFPCRIAHWAVLPNQDTEFVRPIVPALRLDLDVFANHVKPERLLRFQKITFERQICRRGVNAIRPVPLIQRAKLNVNWLLRKIFLNPFLVPRLIFLIPK